MGATPRRALRIVSILAVFAAALTFGPRADATLRFSLKWGSEGTGPGQFNSLYGPGPIALDAAGNVYVSDTNNNRIEKFTPDGRYLGEFGSTGNGNGEFADVSGLAIDAAGNIFVADYNNYRVQKLDANGAYVTQWGTFGSADGQFLNPWGIATDANGNVYVTDLFNHRVQEFTSQGGFIRKWGSQGFAPGQFQFPTGIAVGPDGSVYVSDTSNNRVQKFTPDGTFLTMWDSGSGGNDLGRPAFLATDPSGNVYLTEYDNNQVEKFSSSGTFLSKFGSSGTGNGEFDTPEGIAVNATAIYVSDTLNYRVQRISQLLPETSITSGPSGLTSDATPSFSFGSDSAYPAFECSVDFADYVTCPQSFTTSALADGAHVLQVEATDSEGTDPTPARRDFTVDATAPQTTIVDHPTDPTVEHQPTFRFISDESHSTFDCKVDGGSFTSCSSPFTPGALADGPHTFSVRATDEALNVDASPDSFSFTVQPLDTTITTRTFRHTRKRQPVWEFSANLSRATFECSIDGAAFAPCSSPFTTPQPLRHGKHQFAVRAKDGAVLDTTPATRTFRVAR